MRIEITHGQWVDIPDATLTRGWLWASMIEQHIEQAYRSTHKSKRRPHIGYDTTGVTLEWWGRANHVAQPLVNEDRKLTVHVGEELTSWIRGWGADDGFAMTSGNIENPFELDPHLRWVMARSFGKEAT